MRKRKLVLQRRLVNLVSKGICKWAPQRAKSIIAHKFFIPRTAPLTPTQRELLRMGDEFELSVRGKRVVGKTYGSGPAILFAHGWGGRGGDFASFVEPLVARGFQAILYDSAGHGLSGRGSSNFFEMVECFNSVAANAGHVAGVVAHSMGAGVVMNPDGRMTTSSAVKYVLIAPLFDLREILHGFAIGRGIHLPLYQELIEIIERHYDKTVSDVSPLTRIGAMRGPALIFHDKQDRPVPLSHAEALAQNWAGAELVTSDGLGHRAILSDREVVERGVTFLVSL